MKKVVTGQQFRPKAATWNSFIDAAVYVKQRQSDLNNRSLRKDTKSGLVIVRNSTDEDLGQFAVVMLGALIITPENNEQEFRSNVPVFEAEKPGEENYEKPFAVLQKPLKKGLCGFAMLSGITPVKLNVESEDHEYAEAASSGLVSSDSGTIRILWKEDGTGELWVVAHVGAGTPGDVYDGYFAVKNVSDEEAQKVKVSFGKALINTVIFDVPEYVINIEEECFIFLYAAWDGGAIAQPVIQAEAEFPAWEEGVFRGLIATVKWDDEKSIITKIGQQHFGMMYGFIWRDC